MLCLGPQVTALIIFLPGHFSHGTYLSNGLHHGVKISLGTHVGGLTEIDCQDRCLLPLCWWP